MMVRMALTQYSCASSHNPISLSGNSGMTGTIKTINVMAGGKRSTQSARQWLEGAHRNQRHEPRDDRFEMIPKPGFDQEDDREKNPDRLKNSSHHPWSSPPGLPSLDHIWIARLPTACAASLMASE